MKNYGIGFKYAIEQNARLKLSSPIGSVFGVDSEDIEKFNKLGIYTVYDLLTFSREDFKLEIYHNSPQQYFTIINAYFSIVENLMRALPPVKDFLPESVIREKGLMPLGEVIKWFHSDEYAKEKLLYAKRRLAFNEIFLIQCGLKLARQKSVSQGQGVSCKSNGELVKKVINSLPFDLTTDQRKAFKDIAQDMEIHIPMRRLVQGDVGSGKTVVAMLALVKAVENGYQGVMMAPTEILAVQHYNNFVDSLGKFGIKVGLLSASITRSKRKREEVYKKISNHELDIVVGTHALIQDEVKFAKLGIAITDEQHRFGVAQRAKLANKYDINPDVLAMTATPIPRTLSLTIYGDLDVSVIKQMPAGRKPIETTVHTARQRRSAYSLVRKEILKGRQAYVVCPLRASSNSDAYSAEEIYEMLTDGYLKGIQGALIHGKMKAAEKDNVMERFKNGEIKYIVSTTVIEVGVNVPNATVMVIENAERFGLAQLHQLRGRVGRGSFQSYCILISSSKDADAQKRLELMESTTDGFKLAEEDLKMRGMGQFFGEKQFGMPDLKYADVLTDMDIWHKSWWLSDEFINQEKYPEYLPLVKEYIKLTFGGKFKQIANI